jgi:hypothetical protein
MARRSAKDEAVSPQMLEAIGMSADAFEQMYQDATEIERRAAIGEPRAKTATFSPGDRSIALGLTNGCVFSFPVSLRPELATAPDAQLSPMTVAPGGDGIHWDLLDVDISVPGLIMLALGGEGLWRLWAEQSRERASSVGTLTRSEVASKAGSTSSPAKTQAARENGKKGGRPRKAGAA